jgi:hypothetical protein
MSAPAPHPAGKLLAQKPRLGVQGGKVAKVAKRSTAAFAAPVLKEGAAARSATLLSPRTRSAAQAAKVSCFLKALFACSSRSHRHCSKERIAAILAEDRDNYLADEAP